MRKPLSRLADGQISNVIKSNGQFVIVKRDGIIQAQNIKLEQVADRLTKIIRDKKMRAVAGDIFKELQKRTRVQNVYNDDKLRQRVGPNVVALVNETPIYLRQLDDECLARHGADVLQGLIGRRMLELACQQSQVTVSEQEIDAEVARLASMLTRPMPDGSPDVKGWLDLVTKQHGRFGRSLSPRDDLAGGGPAKAGRLQDRSDGRRPEEGI